MTAPSAPTATVGTDVHSQAEDEPAERAACLAAAAATDFVFGRTGPATTERDGPVGFTGVEVASGDWAVTGVDVAAGTARGFLTTSRTGAAPVIAGVLAVSSSEFTPRDRRSTEPDRAKQWW